MKSIDLNCDMGELPEAIADGQQERLMRYLTSVNVACGGHAGDKTSMATTIRQASQWDVRLGAHPGYPDRLNFGRVEMHLTLEQIADTVFQQVTGFAAIAAHYQVPVFHVKPHGALYNQAVRDTGIAAAIAEGVKRWRQDVTLVGLADSPMLAVFRGAGFTVAAEAFADRRYEPDGTLRSRRFPDALIHDPESAAEQAWRIVEKRCVTASDGSELPIDAQTICIHGDTPGAEQILKAVAHRLGTGLRIGHL
ncbi:MAG: LamB/YcsF family protein [Acidobacteriota bacterium]|nr:LamB/YcsF family protein [Acidobacteriota bacterium]